MKKIVISFIVLLISNFGFSQNAISPFEQKLYDEAITKINALDFLNIEEEELNIENLKINTESPEVTQYKLKVKQKVNAEALVIFNRILDTMPNTKLLNKINYEMAHIFYQDGKTKLASEYYIKVLNNPDPITEDFENEVRNTICITLVEIFIDNKDFETALMYLEESKKYKIRFDCGNAAMDYSERLKRFYQTCQEGISKKK